MKNLNMRKKIIVSFSIVIVLFLVAIVLTLLGMNNTGKRYTEFYNSRQDIANVRMNLQRSAKDLMLAAVEKDASKINELVESANECMTGIDTEIQKFEDSYQGDNASMLDQLKAKISELKDLEAEAVQLVGDNTDASTTRVHELLKNEYDDAIGEVETLIVDFKDSQNKVLEEHYNSSMRTQKIQMVMSVVLSIVAILCAFTLQLVLVRAVMVPLNEMQGMMNEMKKGELNIDIHYDGKDEFGIFAQDMLSMLAFIRGIIEDMDYLLLELSGGNFTVRSRMPEKYVGEYKPLLESIRKLKVNLNDTLNQIDVAADQVASGSDQVSSGAQALSQGATQQASSVEELAATINEISGHISQNADSAKEASDNSKIVKEHAEESSRRMQEMLAAMQNISDTSGEIGKIIKTIEDIAFQTNILALNAAVEAARAGAAGKGFAVVADEVRNLAGKSAEASKNTSTLIESSLQAVDQGTKIANDTARALGEVVTGVEEVAATIEQISSASEEQANAASQVTQGIDQISSVVQTNSATAEESAAASEELSGQAHMLKELVSQFKLEGGSMPVSAPAAPAVSYDDSYATSYAPAMSGDKY